MNSFLFWMNELFNWIFSYFSSASRIEEYLSCKQGINRKINKLHQCEVYFLKKRKKKIQHDFMSSWFFHLFTCIAGFVWNQQRQKNSKKKALYWRVKQAIIKREKKIHHFAMYFCCLQKCLCSKFTNAPTEQKKMEPFHSLIYTESGTALLLQRTSTEKRLKKMRYSC